MEKYMDNNFFFLFFKLIILVITNNVTKMCTFYHFGLKLTEILQMIHTLHAIYRFTS